VLISLPAAKVIGQRDFRGKAALEVLLLAPYLVSATAVAMGLYTVFIRLGLNNTNLGVMLSMLIPTTPMMVRMLTSVFEAYNPEFEEQARALGASPLRVLVHVTIPMITPGIVAGSLFTFLGAINAFFYPYLIGGGRVKMLAVLLYQFMGQGGYDLPITAAISIILAVPGFLFLIFSDKLIKEEYFALGFGGG
jgi:putative spermidine/putrescine transport system permease protein